jgi:hypothetical protein
LPWTPGPGARSWTPLLCPPEEALQITQGIAPNWGNDRGSLRVVDQQGASVGEVGAIRHSRPSELPAGPWKAGRVSRGGPGCGARGGKPARPDTLPMVPSRGALPITPVKYPSSTGPKWPAAARTAQSGTPVSGGLQVRGPGGRENKGAGSPDCNGLSPPLISG